MDAMVAHDLHQMCERNPLSAHSHFASNDRDEAQHYVESIFCNHDLAIAGRNQHLSMAVDHAAFGAVNMVFMTYGADVLVTPGALENFYLVQVPVKGHATIRFGNERLDVVPGRATVQHPDAPLEMRWAEDCRKLILRVDRLAFERYVERCTGRRQEQGLRLDPALDLASFAGQALMDQLRAGLRCAEQFGPQSVPAMMAQHIEQSVMSALLCLHPHDRSDEFAVARSGGESRAIARVRAYLEEHAAQPVDSAMLAEVAGVPLRTLYHLFQRSLGKTPMQLLRDVRLDRARQDLMTADTARTVTAVALDWGFDHLGRFARDYRLRFGEAPSATRRRN